jgi:hypothetical protein
MTTVEQIQNHIIELVSEGIISGVEIVSKTTRWAVLNNLSIESIDIPTIMYELSTSGQIIEIEYTLPSNPERIKSIFFPKNTEFNKLHVV